MQTENDDRFAILFVDDEEKTRKYFDRAFSREHRIYTAAGVAPARALLEEHGDHIGVLITDQRMPEEKGVVLLRHARKYYPHIVRILTTAYSDLDDAIESVNTGEILRYITKPWDLKLLGSELRHAMRFFYLQREHDQLLQEKLSVQQRLIEVNRARDLIVMAGSFSQVRNPLQAIRAFLLQLPIREKVVEKITDRWQLLEEQLGWILETARTVIDQTDSQGTAFELVDVAQLLTDAKGEFEGAVKIDATFAENLPQLIAQIPLIQKLLRLLLSEQVSLTGGTQGAQIKLSARVLRDAVGNEEGVRILFYNPGSRLAEIMHLCSTSGLLSAFFITYHHGGKLDVFEEGGISFELSLPLNGAEVNLGQPSTFWLDEIFAQYETE